MDVRRNGYTLVELLAVVVILTAILLIVVPSLVRVFDRSDQQLTDANVAVIKAAAEQYVSENETDFPALQQDGGTVTITVGDLKDHGYLSKVPVDSKTEKPIATTTKITVKTKKDRYEIQVIYP